LYLPYTVSKANYKDESLLVIITQYCLQNSKADLPKIKTEFDQIVFTNSAWQDWDLLIVHADSYLETFTRQLFVEIQKQVQVLRLFVLVTTVFALLFLLLPTLNLININTSRIMERSSEIGVRKAFGASSKTLVLQFVVENLFLHCWEGLLAIILSAIILKILNSSDLLQNVELSINATVVSYVCNCNLSCIWVSLRRLSCMAHVAPALLWMH